MCILLCKHNEYSNKMHLFESQKVKSLSHVRLFTTPWTVVYQAPPSMGFSRQEYWSGLPFPSPGDLPDPGIKPGFPALQADTLTSEPPRKSYRMIYLMLTISFCHSFFIHFLVEVIHHLIDTGSKEGKQTHFFFFFMCSITQVLIFSLFYHGFSEEFS